VHLGVLDLIYRRAGMYRTRAAVSSFRLGKWSEFRFEDVQRGAQHLSNYLIDKGVKHGDRIAIVSESNAEFGVVFFAVIRAGTILVPYNLYQQPQILSIVLGWQTFAWHRSAIRRSERCWRRR
jgi:acyl-CoA synthetase (AMP-forming)/AMP-acid ligase II